jgi:FkbM family methyltransferase
MENPGCGMTLSQDCRCDDRALGTDMNVEQKRPDAVSLAGHDFKRISRSQVAEDLLATFYLGREHNITYVDIGCLWPIKFSNTYYFYERSGHGLCIDPNPTLSESYRAIRPRDTFVNYAVGGSSEDLTYYEFENPVFNTLDPKRVAALKAADRPGRRVIRTSNVAVKPLHQILIDSKFSENHGAIDFLSIDVEGLEMEILKAIDFTVITPKLIVIETAVIGSKAHDNPAVGLFTAAGYDLVGFTGHDAFFRRR